MIYLCGKWENFKSSLFNRQVQRTLLFYIFFILFFFCKVFFFFYFFFLLCITLCIFFFFFRCVFLLGCDLFICAVYPRIRTKRDKSIQNDCLFSALTDVSILPRDLLSLVLIMLIAVREIYGMQVHYKVVETSWGKCLL